MRDNVLIKVRERGKLIETREGHNIFVDRGRTWLRDMLAYTSFSPDTPVRSERIRYMGFGIGGVGQNSPIADTDLDLSLRYSAGFDPNATNGHEYDTDNPINPLISTLERPVRISGSQNAYTAPQAADRWLVYEEPAAAGATQIYFSHKESTELTVHAFVSPPSGDLIYGVFTEMPLSEAGLFIDESGVDPLNGLVQFKPLVAYFTFGTITLTSTMELEVVWSVRF